MAKRGGWDGTYRRIDIHVHGRPFGRLGYRGGGAAYVKRIRAQGIDAVGLLGPGEMCRKAVAKFGRDFIIPVPMYRLRGWDVADLQKDIAKWLAWGVPGIKFTAPLDPYCHERYWPLYSLVDDAKAVAVFHTGYLGFGGDAPEIPPTKMTDMRAGHIDALGRRFPKLRILMAHFSNPWWEEGWKVSWTRPNIYADLSGGTAFQRSLDMWAQTFAPNGQLLAGSLSKVLFASDVSYLFSGEHKFAPYIDFYEKLFDRVNAPQRIRRLVNAGNAMKLFGLK